MEARALHLEENPPPPVDLPKKLKQGWPGPMLSFARFNCDCLAGKKKRNSGKGKASKKKPEIQEEESPAEEAGAAPTQKGAKRTA